MLQFDLCHSFRAAASTMFLDYQAGRGLGLVPWETTFTDTSLLSISRAHARSIHAHRFDGAMEAKTGTDWEWWIRSPLGTRGLRIQAKRRALATNAYGTTKKVGTHLQVELLLRRGAARRTTPLYCLYGDQVPGVSPVGASPGPCPHGIYDPTLWGASLVSAHTVWAHEKRGQVRPRPDLLERARPWHQLVCWQGGPSSMDLLAQVDSFLAASIETAELAATDLLPADLIEQATSAIALSAQVRELEPPSDVEVAFRQADASLVRPDRGVAGVVLLDALQF